MAQLPSAGHVGDSRPFGMLNSNDVLALLTLALVVVTAYYAWQTHQTVVEMRRARGVAVLPRLVIGMKALGAGVGWPQVTNVGPGTALDVDATVSYEPGGASVPWRAHVVASGESHELFPPDPDKPDGRIHHIGALTRLYTHVRLVATYRDALGDVHRTDERAEIRDWWRMLQDSRERLPHNPAEETVQNLVKIESHLKSLADEAHAIRQRGEADPWLWERRVGRLPTRWRPLAKKVLGLLGRNI